MPGAGAVALDAQLQVGGQPHRDAGAGHVGRVAVVAHQLPLAGRPAFDYGRTPGEWELVGDDRHAADVTGSGVTVRLTTDLQLGIEGNRARARHVLQHGEQVYCSLSWAEEFDSPQTIDEANARLGA